MRKLISILLLMALPVLSRAYEFKAVEVNGSNNIVIRPTNFWVANSNDINAVILHPEPSSFNAISNAFYSFTAATLDGFTMTPAVQGGTNLYWWDFGQTNSLGQKLIYATLTATNDVEFIGVTNCAKWRLLSFNVVASGGNRNLRLPTTLPHLDTNGLVLTNGALQLTLTNGNEFRMTIQSNSTLSTLWTTFGQ